MRFGKKGSDVVRRWSMMVLSGEAAAFWEWPSELVMSGEAFWDGIEWRSSLLRVTHPRHAAPSSHDVTQPTCSEPDDQTFYTVINILQYFFTQPTCLEPDDQTFYTVLNMLQYSVTQPTVLTFCILTMSHDQLDQMLEYHAIFCHTGQYFVTLCNTSAILCHPTHSPCHPEQGACENRRKPSLWTLGKRQPCDLQEVCGLHLERKGKVSGLPQYFAILL